jgi:L-aspartate oxidase
MKKKKENPEPNKANLSVKKASSGRHEFDLLVIGSGISGLAASISAAEKGYSVAVISKETSLTECNTRYAQGGIIGSTEEDSPELLENDILYAGDRINYEEAVHLLVREGPPLVEEFLVKKLGVSFSREKNGKPNLTREAAHSIRRIYHVMDKTGEAIETQLVRYAARVPGINFFPNHTAIDLITNTHNSRNPQEWYKESRVIGAYVLDNDNGKVNIFFARAVILATGGAGNLFLHTSNPPGSTGDGLAMALRIGAAMLNCEYIQFHPTILYHRDVKRFLISESLRGEGARLMNLTGEYFMEKYTPDKDLAPRDEVARAIYREMENDNSEYVKLDARCIEGIDLKERFPEIFQQCKTVGIDIRNETIPVVPGAHYLCGGIKVKLSGEASIAGLYAAGESACTGIHGANRLASVSLLEGLYWGIKSGKEAVTKTPPLTEHLKKDIPDWIYPATEEVFDPLLVMHDFRTIRSTMWNYAGIIRSRKRLLRAQADLDYLSHRIEQFYREAKLTKRIIELRNSVITAAMIVQSALVNPVSKGCHYIESLNQGSPDS